MIIFVKNELNILKIALIFFEPKYGYLSITCCRETPLERSTLCAAEFMNEHS